jgi:hypothetical protein
MLSKRKNGFVSFISLCGEDFGGVFVYEKLVTMETENWGLLEKSVNFFVDVIFLKQP